MRRSVYSVRLLLALEGKMLRRGLLPAITSCLSGKNWYCTNSTYCSKPAYNSSHEPLQDTNGTNNIMQVKDDVKGITANEEDKMKPKGKKKKPASRKKELVVIKDLQEVNPNIVNTCPRTIMKALGASTNMLYLIDDSIAEQYVSLVREDLLKNTCFVAEMNPGFGMLSKHLLKAGVPLIHLYEARKEFYPILTDIQNAYPDQMDVRNSNLINITQLVYLDRYTDGKHIQELLRDVENKNWEGETSMQIIGATNSSSFLRHMINSLLFRNCLMSKGRPVFYIAIPPSFWHKYTCDINNAKIYTAPKVVFQVMFCYELLGKLDRKAFVPSPRRKLITRRSQISEAVDEDYENLYVVKIEPRVDLYSELTKKDWIIFWYFVRHHMRRRTARVIPELEKWVPGCGIRLIARLKYTIFTYFGDLTPVEILQLFKEFKSWPEYEESYFLDSMSVSLSTYEPALMDLEMFELDE